MRHGTDKPIASAKNMNRVDSSGTNDRLSSPPATSRSCSFYDYVFYDARTIGDHSLKGRQDNLKARGILSAAPMKTVLVPSL